MNAKKLNEQLAQLTQIDSTINEVKAFTIDSLKGLLYEVPNADKSVKGVADYEKKSYQAINKAINKAIAMLSE